MFYILLILGVVSRLVPHGANFTALGAIGLFAGNKLGVKKASVLIILIMLITDLMIGFRYITPFVYAGMIAYVLISTLIKNKVSILYSSLLGSILFFLISNFGVWLGPWYEHTLAGLIRCFEMAVPFFRGTVSSDLIYSIAIFGVYAIFNLLNKNKQLTFKVLSKQRKKISELV